MTEESGRETGHVAVQVKGGCLFQGTAQELFLEGPAQPGTGQISRCLARQRQVADDHADPGTVEGRGDAIVEGPFPGMEQEAEQGIEI
jgi:hypothetical protein